MSEEKVKQLIKNAIRLPTNNKGEVILDPHNETHRDWYESFDDSEIND